jgi:hypothetical protein
VRAGQNAIDLFSSAVIWANNNIGGRPDSNLEMPQIAAIIYCESTLWGNNGRVAMKSLKYNPTFFFFVLSIKSN